MKNIGLVVLTLACVRCQTASQDVPVQGGIKSPAKTHEMFVDIDPFYQSGVYPKIKLQGQEATDLRAIIKSAPKVDLKPIPRGMTVSPAAGLSVIEDGEDLYHITLDCEIVGRRVSPEHRLRIFHILSKHTSHFKKPKA